MKFCKECGNALEEEALFCPQCGTPWEEEPAAVPHIEIVREPVQTSAPEIAGESANRVFGCPQCGAVAEVGEVFCGECGARLDAVVPETVHREQNQQPSTAEAQEEMIFCPECGAKNDGGFEFCLECGAKLSGGQASVPAMMNTKKGKKEKNVKQKATETELLFCPECGNQNEPGSFNCSNCGTSLKPNKKKKDKKVMMGAAAVIAAVVVIGAGISFGPKLFGGKSDASNMLLYYKDGSTYQYGVKNGKKLELTDKTLDEASVTVYDGHYSAALDTEYTSDGDYVFYYERYDTSVNSGTLYYRSAKNTKSEGEKVDSDVMYFDVTDKNNIFYTKRDGNMLYQYSIKKKDKEKLASDVNNWLINDAEDKIVWVTNDSVLYTKQLKQDSDKEKLDSDVEWYSYASDDLNSIYYAKEGAIYHIKNLKDKEKVASEANIVNKYKDGGIYYTEAAEADLEITYADYVEDDMAEADRAMREPQESDYYTQVKTWAGVRNELDRNAYNAARDAYREKENRDSIRTQLAENYVIKNNMLDLYVYDGKESKLIAPSVLYESSYLFTVMENIEPLKIMKMSQISSFSDIENRDVEIRDAFANEFTSWVLGRDAYVSLVMEPTSYKEMDVENNTLFIVTKDGDTYDSLYQYDISGGTPQETKLDSAMEDADQFMNLSGENGGFYYYKDINDDYTSGTLYKDGKKICDDVVVESSGFTADGSDIYTLTDYNSKNCSSTLKKVSGEKTVKIADDISAYRVYKGGAIAYLQDFSQKRNKGDLYVWKGNKEEKIDDDVTYFYGSKYAYGLY